MLLDQLNSAGALPALEQAMRFAGQRQRLIAHNVANLETPDFRPTDVSPGHFQSLLQAAVDERRARTGGGHGGLSLGRSREIEGTPGGGLALRPRTASGNVLFHDRNDRDLERTMQAMVENAGAYRVTADLLRNRTALLRGAIAERVA